MFKDYTFPIYLTTKQPNDPISKFWITIKKINKNNREMIYQF
jgi:hypothetical protein